MKYCPRCKCILPADAPERCGECGKRLVVDPAGASPVRLVTAKGVDFQRACDALSESGIPFSHQIEQNDAVIRMMIQVPAAFSDVFVRLSDYDTALEVMQEIGLEDERRVQPDSEQLEKIAEAKKEQTESEELSPGKARLVRIISGIAFLLILAGVVFLTDFVIAWVKTLFA